MKITARAFGLLGVWALCGLSVGCSGGILPARDDSSVTIEELKRRVLDLQRQATINEVEITRLRQRLTELESKPAPTPQRENRSNLEPLIADPVSIEPFRAPQIEEDDLEPEAPTQPPLRSTAPRESAGLEQGAVDGGGEGLPALEAVTEQGQQLYDRGYSLYHQGEYRDAESEFQRFLASYADTDLADNAQYWIGESRYARKDFPGALAAFRETVERFPGGNKVPDALVKAGQCFEAQGDLDAALETYREVVRRYPESAAAARAAERARALR